MTAQRELIWQVIESRLKSIIGIAEVERMPSGDPMDFPAIHIFDGGQKADNAEVDVSRYDMPVLIEGYLEAAGGSVAHAAINELYADVVRMLIADPPLDGLAETIDEGDLSVVVAPLASKSRLSFSLEFGITFPTRRGDPAQTA